MSPGIQKEVFTCSAPEWSCYSSGGLKQKVELSWLLIDFQTGKGKAKFSLASSRDQDVNLRMDSVDELRPNALPFR